MKSPGQHRIRIFEINFRAVTIALTLTLLFASVAVLTPAAQAQTFNVIHTFTGAGDGGSPSAGVTFDKAEKNLYGTTYYYGTHGYGAVYQLKQKQGKWTVNPLYSFAGGKDGAYPQARVIFGPDGSLYGTTDEGGSSNLGTVFKLRPPASACKTALCAWTETELYAFKGSADGAYPGLGDLLFDQGGNIYGTTVNGGSPHNIGVVYELTPSGPPWTESVLYSFSGNDGATPWSNVTFDSAGNLYGTTDVGGLYSSGTAFQLMPSMGGWTENILNNWRNGNDGGHVVAGLIFDQAGNLYGATDNGGTGGGGTVFELTPPVIGNTWTYTLLYSFTGPYNVGCGPQTNLVMDGAGNLYGTTVCDGANKLGNVFELTPSGGGWTYKDLHDFTGGNDGKNPYSNVTLDENGNLYGTAYAGGSQGVGVVWEITFP